MKAINQIILALSVAAFAAAALAAPDKADKQAGKAMRKGEAHADKMKKEMDHESVVRAKARDHDKMMKDSEDDDDEEGGDRDKREGEDEKGRNGDRDGDENMGSDRSQEMKARNAEKAAIKEAYRESGEKIKGKKPWWKFWESEDQDR